MKEIDNISGYRFGDTQLHASHDYLLPDLIAVLSRTSPGLKTRGQALRAFDLGCGNGSVAQAVAQQGWLVTGVDPSLDGQMQRSQQAKEVQAGETEAASVSLHRGSAYSDLADEFGQFPVVYSLEVVEHLYAPRDYAATLFNLVEPGGVAVVSTPYHGYLKNLALALSGKMDQHFTALWDHGHIKFWSIKTLSSLLGEAGFTNLEFSRVGRFPALAKSMIVVCRRPV